MKTFIVFSKIAEAVEWIPSDCFQKMKFKIAFALFITIVACHLVIGGVFYNADSVCTCQGLDNIMHRCLCEGQQMELPQSRFQVPATHSRNQQPYGNYGQFNDFRAYQNFNPNGNGINDPSRTQSNSWRFENYKK